jgi:hypothetical protein
MRALTRSTPRQLDRVLERSQGAHGAFCRGPRHAFVHGGVEKDRRGADGTPPLDKARGALSASKGASDRAGVWGGASPEEDSLVVDSAT